MTPREVIAKGIHDSLYKADMASCPPFERCDFLVRQAFLLMADAVIDALASMEPTDTMIEAYLDQTGDPLSEFGWAAAVGAMRDE